MSAPLSDTPLPSWPGLLPPWPGELVRVDDSEVYVRRTPARLDTAEPALYVHGLGGASTNWTDLAGLLAERFDGEAVDLPGFGRSPGSPRGDYSIKAHARILTRLIEVRGRGPVHLLGNSLGGLISLLVAADRPDLIRTLTLISPAMPALRPPGRSDPMIPLLLLPGVSRLAEAAAEVTRRADLPWAMDAFTASLRGLVRTYLSRGSNSPWRRARAVQAPTLVIWGDRDRLADVSLAPRTAAAIPGARLLMLAGIGHTAQLEDAPTTARAVLALVEAAAAGGDSRRGSA